MDGPRNTKKGHPIVAPLGHQVPNRDGRPQSTSKEIDDLVFFQDRPTCGMK